MTEIFPDLHKRKFFLLFIVKLSCFSYMKEIHTINTHKNLFQELMEKSREILGFSEMPKLVLMIDKINENDAVEKKVALYISGRHVKDIMRSLSHELVHHAQNCRGDLENLDISSGNYAQEDDYASMLEREAYERGNMIFREWCDGIKYGGENI
jgi:hypothetical protein